MGRQSLTAVRARNCRWLDNGFSNCIDLSHRLLTGEMLLFACYRVVSVLEKEVTVVAWRTTILVLEVDTWAQHSTCLELPIALFEALSSARFDRQGKHVADPALGLDDTARARIGLKLAPQPPDLHVDASVEDILMHPGRLQEVLAGEWPLGGIEKGDQQGIFALRQGNRGSLGVGQPSGTSVELPAAEPVAAPLRIPLRRRTSG